MEIDKTTLTPEQINERLDTLIAANRALRTFAAGLAASIKQVPRAPYHGTVITIFFRALEATGAALALAEQGFMLDAGNCARIVLEARFIIRRCKLEPDWAKKFLASELPSRKKLTSALLALEKQGHPEKLGDGVSGLEAQLENLEKEIKDLDAHILDFSSVATHAKLLPEYDRHYRTTSQVFCHASASVTDLFFVGEDDSLVAFQAKPDLQIGLFSLSILYHSLLPLIGDVTEIFQSGEEQYSRLLKKLSAPFDSLSEQE